MPDSVVDRWLPADLQRRARALDASDPLADYADEFVRTGSVVAYLDGNSLGRPLRVTRRRLGEFVEQEWGDRLIRSWDERWMARPATLGDRIAAVTLGAAPGQTVVADSTTVLLYKLVRAAIAARPGRDQIVADVENFPTDRYIVDTIAHEAGLTVRWLHPDPAAGVTVQEVRDAVSERTALVALSHVAFKSAYVCDLPAITAAAHEVGALVLWDLCHSVGAVPLDLDDAEVDLAVGCTYKYLNGGPGSPAFAYVAAARQAELTQPITGWMGDADPFTMGSSYEPAVGIRRFLSGTPPILAMVPVDDMLSVIERAGMTAVREKSVRLTSFAVDLSDAVLAPAGARLASPRDPAVRGGHVTLEHPDMGRVVAALWERGVIPDFRPPQGLRAGLSPLSTGFGELATSIAHIRDALSRLGS